MIYCYAKIFSTITTHSKNKQKYADVLFPSQTNMQQAKFRRFNSREKSSSLKNMKNGSFGRPGVYKLSQNGCDEFDNSQKLSVPSACIWFEICISFYFFNFLNYENL